MKNWKLAYKITAINCGIVVFIGIICGAFNAGEDFALVLGNNLPYWRVNGFGSGSNNFNCRVKAWGKGFLNSAGILLLLSGISCGTGLSNVNFH
jgi:hypothetical protein